MILCDFYALLAEITFQSVWPLPYNYHVGIKIVANDTILSYFQIIIYGFAYVAMVKWKHFPQFISNRLFN